ncbi:PREDICTED: proline-rich protein 3-like [Camelina sativa]|uniref:Proline-rich protein 3-like n=1 Tax=Camelina sativa TaxID=90675 RepID=A0ABM0YYD8_CAMSA|nr:PREDICTED: proline-rich protein 3-like [Camelina sativa]
MVSTSPATSILLLALVLVVAAADYYVPLPTTYSTPSQPYVPIPATTYTSPVETQQQHFPKRNPDFAIEGLILCKSGYKTYPIQGAKVKVVCPIFDSYGKLVAKVTISSYPTDLKGYFYFVAYGLSLKVKNINSCNVKLESSPLSACKTPTNVNKGVTGAPLSSDNSNFLSHDNLILYTLEPFYFSSPVAPKPVY